MHNAVGMAVLGPRGRLISSVSPESTNLSSRHRFSLHSEVIEGGNGGEVRFVGEVSPIFKQSSCINNRHEVCFPPSRPDMRRSPQVERDQLEWVEFRFRYPIEGLMSLTSKDAVLTLPPKTGVRYLQAINEIIL